MKGELATGFGIPAEAITVIPFGINNSVPQSTLTPAEARLRLGLRSDERVLLFFGNIAPYKGLDYLVAAFRQIAGLHGNYRLIVAGRPKKGAEAYWDTVSATLSEVPIEGLLLRIEFIPDEETEVYFKAADVLVLPYTSIFQSGVLFLGYSFGLPVLAADVGSLREDIVERHTGFVFASQDSAALVNAIETYFESELFRGLSERRRDIQQYANGKHSWDLIARTTRDVYAGLQGPSRESARLVPTSRS